MRPLLVLLALLLFACHGTLSVEALHPPDDDDSATVDDDDVVPEDDDDVVPDDDDVAPDDDDVVPDDDDFFPDDDDVGPDDDDVVVPECDSGPDAAATAQELIGAAELDPTSVVSVETPDSFPEMFAAREGLGVLCPLVGDTMGLMSTGNVVNIEALEDHDYPGDGAEGDRATLVVSVVAPDDATSLRYHFLFLSREVPEWIGSKYTDTFEAEIAGSAYSGPIAFDGPGDPITVNTYMALLEGDLAGTGFDVDGGTGWIRMDVPVTPGEPVTLTFAIYDQGDGTFDSAVLLDGFEWRSDAISEPDATLVWP